MAEQEQMKNAQAMKIKKKQQDRDFWIKLQTQNRY
jgi:hypothetical protein